MFLFGKQVRFNDPLVRLSRYIAGSQSFRGSGVVYFFDQPMGAPHAVSWSKSTVFAFKQVFLVFFRHKCKKERKKIEGLLGGQVV